MLVLVGSGINGDLTLDGIEELKKCDVVYVEIYTNPPIKEKLPDIESRIGKKIVEIGRDKVESDFLVLAAVDKGIALISSGDPLIATTHVVLVTECRKKNIPVKSIHNSSIYTVAPAKSGLQIYRFGKTVSLVNPREKYKPTSSLEGIRENLKMDMHSLVLLDTEPEPMDAKTALKMLSEFENAVVLSRLGGEDEQITFGRISELLGKDLGKPPFAVIIPAKLHVVEEEYLDWYKC